MDDGDEKRLVQRLQAGDESAYEVVLREYGPRLMAVARRMLGQDADAEDALQEAFVSAFKAIGSFKADSRVSTWLHSIVVRACLMRLRSRRRHPEASIEGLLPTFIEDGHWEAPQKANWRSIPEEAISAETQATVRKQIERLPDDYRDVVILRDIEGLDTAQTAQVLRVSEAVVKTRLHRARQAIKTLLDPFFREELP